MTPEESRDALRAELRTLHTPDRVTLRVGAIVDPGDELRALHALDREAIRVAAAMDPGGRYACTVPGCGWFWYVPRPQMRVEASTASWIGASRDKVQAHLAVHIETHASNGAPPPSTPPDWTEHERCDSDPNDEDVTP